MNPNAVIGQLLGLLNVGSCNIFLRMVPLLKIQFIIHLYFVGCSLPEVDLGGLEGGPDSSDRSDLHLHILLTLFPFTRFQIPEFFVTLDCLG
jgi:hypothetical protein